MKAATAGYRASTRPYPHVISSVGARRNHRWRVNMCNEPVEDPNDGTWLVTGSGSVGPSGIPTAVGRRNLIRGVSERARTSKAYYCIVWSEQTCTFFLPDGSLAEGFDPPAGDFVAEDPDFDTSPLELESVWSTPLSGREPSHLCIKRSGEFVEVMAGAHIELADFRDFAAGCDPDPAAPFRAPGGSWRKNVSWRGQPVHAVVDGGLVLGPVQPLERTRVITLRSPWPHQLAAACNEIAGRRIPGHTFKAAWAAVSRRGECMPLRDVLDAA